MSSYPPLFVSSPPLGSLEHTVRDIERYLPATGIDLTSPSASADVRFRLQASPASVQAARELLTPFAYLCCPAKWFQVELMTSELLTNALIHRPAHEAGWVDLQLHCTAHLIWVTVINPGAPFVPNTHHQPCLDDTGGRGLWLIDNMAASWGVDRMDLQETKVWFTSSLHCNPECNCAGSSEPERG